MHGQTGRPARSVGAGESVHAFFTSPHCDNEETARDGKKKKRKMKGGGARRTGVRTSKMKLTAWPLHPQKMSFCRALFVENDTIKISTQIDLVNARPYYIYIYIYNMHTLYILSMTMHALHKHKGQLATCFKLSVLSTTDMATVYNTDHYSAIKCVIILTVPVIYI
jgi:hypothetical protein